MIGHINIDVDRVKWEKIRKLVAIEHEHSDGMNECSICDMPMVDSIIDHMSIDACLIVKYYEALVQAVKVIKAWHGDEMFDIYYKKSPEMELIQNAFDFSNVKN